MSAPEVALGRRRPRHDRHLGSRPRGRGTRLLLSHEGFDGDDPAQQAAMRILGGGWAGHLARRLERTLAGEP
jgi:hypothetical protein